MKLYRYSLTQSNVAQFAEQSYIVSFFRDGNINNNSNKKILYTTPIRSYDSDELNEKLSITYYPEWSYIIDTNRNINLQFVDNTHNPVDLNSLESQLSRTWPTFGKTGGYPEVLITPLNGTNNTVSLIDEYHIANGGAVEEWHQDDLKNFELPKIIGGIMVSALSVYEGERFGPSKRGASEGSYPGLIKDGNAVVNSYSSSAKNAYLTLSAAYRITGFVLQLKIWGAYWIELVNEEGKGTRKIWYESTDKILILPYTLLGIRDYPDFIIPKCYIRDCKNYIQKVDIKEPIRIDERRKECLKKAYSQSLHNVIEYYKIYDSVIELIERISKISDGFFNSHAKNVTLL